MKNILKIILLPILCIALLVQTVQARTLLPQPPMAPYWLNTIHAPQAWAIGANGTGVRVADIDTGMDYTVATTVMSGTVFLPSWTFNPKFSAHSDKISHGTWTASIIEAAAPNAQLMTARVFGTAEGADTGDIARAVYWAVSQHAQVINLSLGGDTPDPVLAKAVKFAANKGVILLCAAGNGGTSSISYPAADLGCHAVSATDPDNQLTSFSQYGKGVFIAAPGSYVGGFCSFQTNLMGCRGYSTPSGTSASTPIVTGAVADLLSLGYTPKQVLEALTLTATKPANYDANKLGAGVVNIQKAATYLQVYYGVTCNRCGLRK